MIGRNENTQIWTKYKRLLVRLVTGQQGDSRRQMQLLGDRWSDQSASAPIYAAYSGANLFASELDGEGSRREFPFAHVRLGQVKVYFRLWLVCLNDGWNERHGYPLPIRHEVSLWYE